MHALISLPKPHTFRIWVYTWLVMLSHAVLRVVQVFPSFVILSLDCVFVRVLWSSIHRDARLSYPVFKPKPSTHRMHDPGSFVPHIRLKVLTDNQMS
jgi:hypothetical protein